MAEKKKGKKWIIILIVIILLAVLLIPIPERYKDGGIVKYRAVLWSYTDYHALADVMGENGEPVMGYEVGYKFEIIGFTVSEEKHFEKENIGEVVYKDLNENANIRDEDISAIEQKYKEEMVDKALNNLDKVDEAEKEKYRDMIGLK